MLSSVPPSEVVYGAVPGSVTHSGVPSMAGVAVAPGMCAVALGGYGERGGRVGFWGDVNFEEETLQVLVELIKA